MSHAAERNRTIWDDIYEEGSFLWYPSEVLVRLVRAHEGRFGFRGTILDHGCGTGNIAEFLVRSGHKVHATDISPAALRTVEDRFRAARLPLPGLSVIDIDRPLAGQLPDYSDAIVWQSLCYGDRPTTLAALRAIIDRLPAGGAFIVNFPGPRDVLALESEKQPDGTRRVRSSIPSQADAILTLPESLDELAAWCDGIKVVDRVEYELRFSRVTNHYCVVYGVKV